VGETVVRTERSPNLNREGRCVLSEAELRCWAADLGREAVRYGAFVALYGALGSGKSTLVRAACRGAGVVGPIPSPTFTLVNRYRLPDGGFVHHVDLYRIESEEEVWELGWQELLVRSGPVFVEWADRAAALLPDDRWDIRLAFAERSDRRTISAQARGDAPRLPA
jgi:tRNA threonylcarbamoyladenosine biosynthesis protein TsaE